MATTMETTASYETMPVPLVYETYIQLVNNAVGSHTFNNLYMVTNEGVVYVAQGGARSCAFFVSPVLVIFGKIARVHATIDGTIADLRQSGWTELKQTTLHPGDVLVWEALDFPDGTNHRHLGFYIGAERAVSMSGEQAVVTEHPYFNGSRHIDQAFRLLHW